VHSDYQYHRIGSLLDLAIFSPRSAFIGMILKWVGWFKLSSLPQEAATFWNSGQYESRYASMVFGIWKPSRATAGRTRIKNRKRTAAYMPIKCSNVVARDRPKRLCLSRRARLLAPWC
jgi:hypothetical protein